MELEKVLLRRRTTRRYLPEQITEYQTQRLIMAAQCAPLAAGDHENTLITVIQNEETVSKLREACAMKRKDGSLIDAFYGAPTLLFISATDISSDHIEYCNAACVIENMLLAATEMELGSTYIWGCLRRLRKNEAAMSLLELPSGYELLSAMAVGYPEVPLSERECAERLKVVRK